MTFLCTMAVCAVRMRFASACPSRCYSRTCSFVDENGKLHLPFLSSSEWSSVQTMKCITQMLLEVRDRRPPMLCPSLTFYLIYIYIYICNYSTEDASLTQHVGGAVIFVL